MRHYPPVHHIIIYMQYKLNVQQFGGAFDSRCVGMKMQDDDYCILSDITINNKRRCVMWPHIHFFSLY